MKVDFANSKIEKLCTSESKARKKLGHLNAEILFQRLAQIDSAPDMEALIRFPGRYHRLTGDRKGQWACTISGGLRLVFQIDEEGIVRLSEITDLLIIDVTDYH